MIRSLLLLAFGSCILSGCGSMETLAEVEFEKSKFGLEYVPDRSLEGYNEKYHPFFQPAGSPSRKYLFNPGDGFRFSNYPKDTTLLKGIEVVVIDTIARDYEKYDRTEAATTLYLDPSLIDRSSWTTFSKFVSYSYSHPDSANELIKWLNYGYNLGDTPDSLYIFKTIYALVYTNIDDLEPVFVSDDNKRSVKLGIDRGIYFKDDTESTPAWLYSGVLTDSIFHYWSGRAELLAEFGEYKNKDVKFKTLYKNTVVQE